MKNDELVSPEVLMEHLRTSHANVQDVIKFVDTKTGALTGLVTLVLAFPFFLVQYITGDSFDANKWNNPFPSVPNLPAVSLTFLGMSLLGGISSIYCSMNSLIARPPASWLKPKATPMNNFCILFPFYTPNQTNEAHEYFSKIVSGITQKELLTEYQHQAVQLGRIVERKIRWHRWAARMFTVQLVLPLFFLIPYHALRSAWLLLLVFKDWAISRLQACRKAVRRLSASIQADDPDLCLAPVVVDEELERPTEHPPAIPARDERIG